MILSSIGSPIKRAASITKRLIVDFSELRLAAIEHWPHASAVIDEAAELFGEREVPFKILAAKYTKGTLLPSAAIHSQTTLLFAVPLVSRLTAMLKLSDDVIAWIYPDDEIVVNRIPVMGKAVSIKGHGGFTQGDFK